MTGLASRALQDTLTRMQLEINQLKRNASMGTAIEWAPVGVWSTAGAIIPDPDALAWWVRHGSDLTGWFSTRTTGNSVSGTGSFYVFFPPTPSTADPYLSVPIEVEDFGGLAHPLGGISVIGYWQASTGHHGWIFPVQATPNRFGFGYTSAYPTGTVKEADNTIFDKNTVVHGFITAKIADGF